MKPYETISDEEEIIGKAVVNAAYKVHKELDPGLLEKIYETFITNILGFWQCYWFQKP
ncbi:MAG: GxxExxY protein [Lentimicrobium sp.]|nr:GxxExxY protein [Lentimicrobium sp.]MDD2527876.1 GxxExxY protein [Lentimicrobiaceae bacterium]MDD4597925.1 GxxExxY protein [Lentimicrobiaceae bacterium]MDY0024389.1 GxxExxY protein [Lentimicrobium sp.]